MAQSDQELAKKSTGSCIWEGLQKYHCRNVTYKERIKNTSWGLLYGEKKDVSKFRPPVVGCRVWIHLNNDWRKKGKTAPRAVEVVNLSFASDLQLRS